MSKAEYSRKTKETEIEVKIAYPTTGKINISTGIGFFDHMLTLFAKHGGFDMEVTAKGDLNVDAHHTVEDVGICLGKTFSKLFPDFETRNRFGHSVVPMDEALAETAIDLSGRSHLEFTAELPKIKLGDFDIELTEEFFKAFVNHFKITLHIILRSGRNMHHCLEAVFKSFAKALAEALMENKLYSQFGSSTKGTIDK
ncbi:MAG: imidazoleglycerol-phosphate dehydratase HisB [Candidatus Hydrogenedentes bacterium]|nr:imidazoleglycerol-phosphate dehydratase HisB [Candidatus Hydrogenedentota bacterium]